MSAPEMVLQYVNALKWPVFVGGFLLLFKAEGSALLKRLKSLDVNAAGASAKADFQDQATRAADSIEAAAQEAAAGSVEPVVKEIEPLPTDTDAATTAKDALSEEHARIVVVEPGPGVKTASMLSKAEREEVAGLARGLIAQSLIMKRTRQDSDGPPAATIDIRMHKVDGWLTRIQAIAHPDQKLWPGTPPNIANGYRQLHLLWSEARPESVTLEALSEFNRAVTAWSNEYGEFVLQAVEGANELPTWVRKLTSSTAAALTAAVIDAAL